MDKSDRIEVLDWLRGFAAISVAWFHFTNGSGLYSGWIKASGAYGWIGVDTFFAISGFVIPYAMHRGGYRGPGDAGTFMLKRLTRLEPPYLASLILTVGLLYASSLVPGFRGEPPNITPARVLLHLGYLNVFFGRDWFNPVYWTLAVEFQFYLSMILLFQGLRSDARVWRWMTLGVMGAAALIAKDTQLLFPFLGIFALGAIAFQLRSGIIGRVEFAVATTAMFAVSYLALGLWPAIAGLLTAIFAAFAVVPRIPAIAFLGTISYSVYLLHVPIGGRVLNLAGRLPAVWHAPALLLSCLATAVAAWALWFLVERPSQRLSSGIRYLRNRKQLATTPPVLREAPLGTTDP